MMCPICGFLLMHDVSLNTFACPKGHYKAYFRLGEIFPISPLTLSTQWPSTWEDEEQHIAVPQVFQDAFEEVLEP